MILPQLEQTNLYETLRFDQNFTFSSNVAGSTANNAAFNLNNPSSNNNSNYFGVQGGGATPACVASSSTGRSFFTNGVLDFDSSIWFRDITDGTSNVFAAAMNGINSIDGHGGAAGDECPIGVLYPVRSTPERIPVAARSPSGGRHRSIPQPVHYRPRGLARVRLRSKIMDGIVCPRCGGATRVAYTRKGQNCIRRGRRCIDPHCDHAIPTIEHVAGDRPSISGLPVRDLLAAFELAGLRVDSRGLRVEDSPPERSDP